MKKRTRIFIGLYALLVGMPILIGLTVKDGVIFFMCVPGQAIFIIVYNIVNWKELKKQGMSTPHKPYRSSSMFNPMHPASFNNSQSFNYQFSRLRNDPLNSYQHSRRIG
jgi:hypothetical protein